MVFNTSTTSPMYLKVVDTFTSNNETLLVSSYVLPTSIKFLLLHSTRNEEGIKSFFEGVYKLYLKLQMNPFYEYDTTISSVEFKTRVSQLM